VLKTKSRRIVLGGVRRSRNKKQIRVKQPRNHLAKKKLWKFLGIAVYRLLDPASG